MSYPPVLVAKFLLLYQVPGFLHFCFKGPKVNIYLHLVFAFEILWHSPRVPAGASSPILEFTRGKYISRFIHDLHSWRGNSPAVLCDNTAVAFTRPAGN